MKKLLAIFTIITLCGCDDNNIKHQPSLYKFKTIEDVGDSIIFVRRLENKEVICYQQTHAIWCYKK